MNSNGQHGGEVGEPTALYVCGAPGLGKTSGVSWCCQQAVASWESSALEPAPEPKIFHINAGFLVSKKHPLQSVLNELGKCLGTRCDKLQTSSFVRNMKSKKERPNDTLVILVVDEIDSLVSGAKSPDSDVLLRTLLEWANAPDMQMALIRISNCMNDENVSRIHEVGSVSCP